MRFIVKLVLVSLRIFMKVFIAFAVTFLIFISIVTAEESTIGASGGIVIGYNYYIPKLTSIRNKVGGLKDETGIYVAIHVPTNDKKGAMIGYSGYNGKSESFNIHISNIIANYSIVATKDSSRLALWAGAGGNLLYMERHGIPGYMMTDAEYSDWLWGINGLIGIAFRVLGPIHIGYEIGYTWSKESTLGGTIYNLSDMTQTFTINLFFNPKKHVRNNDDK